MVSKKQKMFVVINASDESNALSGAHFHSLMQLVDHVVVIVGYRAPLHFLRNRSCAVQGLQLILRD